MAGEGGAAVLQVLVQNLIDLSTNEISLIRGLNKEAQKLTLNLLTIQQFLNDAEMHTIPTGAVKIWLQRLENAAFEADNVLDEFSYHLLSRKLTCFSFFPHIARKRKMAVSIKEINMDLDSINKMATDFGLREKLADAPTAYDAGMETDSFSSDPIFIGRDGVVSEIVEKLITRVTTHDERVFSILPIVGMGGLGKTTLTRNVFHHQNMKTQFVSRIWVHVSQVFDPINLFNKILKELTPSQSGQGEISRQEIMTKLQEALKDKTYLLVLDDVWNEDDSKWEGFLNSLSGVTTTKGNAIIVTARSMKVASIEGALDIHELEGLSKEDCWKIIRAKTFGNEDVPLDFESIGREIAKRCGGLPLAASVVGGVLRCDKSVDKWVSIRDDWLPEGEGEGENNITKILKLSFNNLSSPSLKKCFAYCSIFPKGERIWKYKLIEMWMAEGFLGRDDMESMGDKFCNVLLHSSLLQNKYWCGMHDLVRDLASSVLGNADGVSRVRYLIHKQGISSPITKEVAEHLRTLIFKADQLPNDTIFSDFKCLHVLTLEGESIKELPRSIRKLIHLRNLNISETEISHLPDWIGELHHLQTLRAQGVWKLPSTIKYLINLRHLHVKIYAELPAEIGRLTSLQTLWREFMVQDKNGYTIEELGSLNNLKGTLAIACLEKVHKEEAEKANLSKKSKLSELWLRWSFDREEVGSMNDEKVLDGLQPHSNLKKLKIEEFRGKSFPEWSMKMAVRNGPQGSWVGLNQLVEIKFEGCRECEEIPMLGHLPNLKSLCLGGLSNVKSINSSFYGIGNETGVVFPVLETLKLCDMDSLKEWAEVESGSTSEVKVFPHIRSLKISNCNQLMKVPFNHFSSCLKSLEISGSNQLTTDSYLPWLSKLTSLTDLVLEGIESLPDELFYNNPNLSVLEIRKCPKLREIPDGLQTLNSLKELIIEECPDLKRIGCSSGGSFTSLRQLKIRECHGLMDFPYEILESQALKKVALEGLSSLSNLPRLIECLAKSAAACLMELRIVGVPKFLATSVTQVWHFPNLRSLKIDVSMEGSRETSVATLDRILQGCSPIYLHLLYLTGMDSWKCLPESIQHLTLLKELELTNFGCEELPEWFNQYISRTSSHFKLKLSECNRLRYLPSTHAMQHLIEEKRVDIRGCPELQQQKVMMVLNSQHFVHPLTVGTHILVNLENAKTIILALEVSESVVFRVSRFESSLECFENKPDELFYNNPNLSVLKIRRCPKLREIPDGLNSSKELIIEKCPDLKRIGCSSGGSLTSLAVLRIRECRGLMDFPYEMVESLSALVLERVVLEGLSNSPRVIECLAKSYSLLNLKSDIMCR